MKSGFKVVREALAPLERVESGLPSSAGLGSGRARSGYVWWSEDGKLKLTAKQKAFCDFYLAGGLMDAKGAYKQAGFSARASEKSIAISVSALLAHAAVRHYIGVTRPKFEGSVLVTRDYVIENLKGVVEGSKNDNARVGALKQLGQFLGMWVDRTEVTGKDGGPVGFADQSQDLSGVPEENLRAVRELLSARKSSSEVN